MCFSYELPVTYSIQMGQSLSYSNEEETNSINLNLNFQKRYNAASQYSI